jgi:hypothetical protein
MAAHKHGHGADESRSASKAYETRDIKLRPLLVFAAGLAVVGVVVYLVVFVLFRLFTGEAVKEDAQLAPYSLSKPESPVEERLPPQPRIQADPSTDMEALRRQEDAILTTYGWVDRQAGVARIPIEVAMKQVLEEGLPVRRPDSAPPAAGTPATPGAASPREQAGTPRGETKKAER